MADEEDETLKKKGNSLPTWGNAQTMNINNLVVTNILSSPYFKNELFKLKTFHEVVDEIYYKVDHLEPWEKGSRKTHGQVGMCGGVRGVGAGGIVSSGYCLLFKLFTLKLTEKQVLALIDHCDSPYIRGIGFMYIRYCLPPDTLWDWYEAYLEDAEEIDPKAGSGSPMTIGQMVRSFMLKLDWYGTLFPRIPVPIHKIIEANLKEYNLCDDRKVYAEEQQEDGEEKSKSKNDDETSFGEAEKYARQHRDGHKSRSHSSQRSDRDKYSRDSDRDRHRHRDKDKERRDTHRDKDRDNDRSSRSSDHRRSRDRDSRSSHRDSRDSKYDRHNRDRSRDRYRSPRREKHR